MYMCMYVCMCVCMCVCVYACVYACVYVSMYVYVCMHVCMCLWMHVFELGPLNSRVHEILLHRASPFHPKYVATNNYADSVYKYQTL